MYVPARPAPPLLAAGDQFEFDHTLRAQGHRDFAIEPLQRHRHEHADRVAQRRLYFRAMHQLPDVRRTDLLLALRDQHQVRGASARQPPEATTQPSSITTPKATRQNAETVGGAPASSTMMPLVRTIPAPASLQASALGPPPEWGIDASAWAPRAGGRTR